jgi:hypothetical protein
MTNKAVLNKLREKFPSEVSNLFLEKIHNVEFIRYEYYAKNGGLDAVEELIDAETRFDKTILKELKTLGFLKASHVSGTNFLLIDVVSKSEANAYVKLLFNDEEDLCLSEDEYL